MKLEILIVEDDENKRQQLELFLEQTFPGSTISHQRSYNSGLRAIVQGNRKDLVLLDMTMPTYDIGLNEDGGRPQHYAGRAILRQMKRYSVTTPVIVVTQFDVFGEGSDRMTREEIDGQLRAESPDTYFGMVYYNASVDGWKEELHTALSKILTINGG
ncbi:MAG: response regulator [Verrucomicrobia bacterium]|jgi:CheY-like chemotaxis protein|nr:response regulator [Verrucomicrobiota bacterium]